MLVRQHGLAVLQSGLEQTGLPMRSAVFRLAFASSAIMLASMVTATPGHAAGNLFEAIGQALFGQPAPSVAPVQPEDVGPMSVTVGPRRAAPARPRYITAKPAAPAVKLDPEADPNWFLRDPTLRRGDIIVTRTGVIVFDGQAKAEHVSGDFTPLGQTRLLSPIRRQEIADMARGIKTPVNFKPVSASLTTRRRQAEANATP